MQKSCKAIFLCLPKTLTISAGIYYLAIMAKDLVLLHSRASLVDTKSQFFKESIHRKKNRNSSLKTSRHALKF